MRVQGNSFVVTGAGSGLGLATAGHLVGQGARVAIIDIDAMKGERAAEDLGEGTIFIAADSADERQGARAIGMVENALGPLRGLVNCAGVVHAERVAGRHKPHDLQSFERVIRVNLLGVFNMMRLAIAAMRANDPLETGERGVVINTASIAAFDGQVGQAAYAASKGGVAAMTLPVARELGPLGIRVMCIAPGVFATPMMAKMPEEVKRGLGELAPFPSRLGEPAEFAALVQHVIENPYLNGEVIRLDGAMRMPAR
jgi:NAD(P)-dependent dehydrogenase (short-subunit alcohol dehydrogenase family)